MEYKQFPEIEQQNIYCHVKAWHDAGFQGQGVVIWNTESNSEHGNIVTRRIWDSAPQATILQAGLSMTASAEKIVATCNYNGTEYDVENFISKFNVKVITRSIGGGTAENTPSSKYWNNLKAKYNLVFFNASGNDGSEGCGGALPPDVALYISAVNLVKGKPVRPNYSSIGEQNDFATFTGIWSGTSFASPYLAGMCALLIQKYGTWITQEQVVQYFKCHCMDLGDNGFDNSYGWGFPIMGDIKKEIKLTVNSTTMLVDGMEVTLDQAPIQTTDTYRMLVPVRAITESLGADVTWDEETRTATFVL